MSLKCNCCIICKPSIASCVLEVRRYEYTTVYRAMMISIEEHWVNSCHHKLSFNSHNMCYDPYRPPTNLREAICDHGWPVQMCSLGDCHYPEPLIHMGSPGRGPLYMFKLDHLGKRAVDLRLKDPLVSQTGNVTQCRKIKRINICVIIVIICGPRSCSNLITWESGLLAFDLKAFLFRTRIM